MSLLADNLELSVMPAELPQMDDFGPDCAVCRHASGIMFLDRCTWFPSRVAVHTRVQAHEPKNSAKSEAARSRLARLKIVRSLSCILTQVLDPLRRG